MPLSRRLLLAALPFACVGACAPPPSDTALNPSRFPPLADLNKIAVGAVTVGRDTGTPWTSAVGPAYVREALNRTFGFSQSAANARYRLDATLLTLSRPYAGFAMTVTATIAWRVTDTTNGAVIYDKTLRSLGTGTLDDAVNSDSRLRVADQRAVGNNLEQLQSDLYGLSLR